MPVPAGIFAMDKSIANVCKLLHMGVPMSAGPLCLVFPFIFNRPHHLVAMKPYRGINLPYQHFP